MRRVKGVQRAEGNTRERTLTVEFDDDLTSLEEIKAAMERVGYAAEDV